MNQSTKSRKTMKATVLLLGAAVFVFTGTTSRAQAQAAASTTKSKIFAQKLVEETLAKHPELESLGLATDSNGRACVTLADSDRTEIGQKCDRGELAVLRTGKPKVEKEKDAYDVTVPLHVGGKIIGIIGMDFKLDQPETGVLDRASAIASEIEKQIPEKSKLSEPAK